MDKNTFLHELKSIATIHKFLKENRYNINDRREVDPYKELSDSLIKRSIGLLDYAWKELSEVQDDKEG